VVHRFVFSLLNHVDECLMLNRTIRPSLSRRGWVHLGRLCGRYSGHSAGRRLASSLTRYARLSGRSRMHAQSQRRPPNPQAQLQQPARREPAHALRHHRIDRSTGLDTVLRCRSFVILTRAVRYLTRCFTENRCCPCCPFMDSSVHSYCTQLHAIKRTSGCPRRSSGSSGNRLSALVEK
jgi:hypothetical protein